MKTKPLQQQVDELTAQLANMHESLRLSHGRETVKARRIFDLENSNAALKQNMREAVERLRAHYKDLTLADIRDQLDRGARAPI